MTPAEQAPTPGHPPAVPPPPPPPPEPDQEERTLAMLCHLLPIAAGFIAPLVIWLVKKDQSRFLDHHGREALNFQLNVLIATFGLTLIAMALMIFLIGFVIFPLVFVVAIGAMVLEVLAGIAANRGDWHRYPYTYRFF